MASKILAVFAHPDDEAFGTGGTLSKYAAQGHLVYLVCATRGEAGEISDPHLATPETLGKVREEELRCAAETMGVAELIFLGYRDSGMAGTLENQNPLAYINAPDEQVIAQLIGNIRQIQPDIILTFEPNGGYGHPDHIAVHRHTVAAFHQAALSDLYPQLGPSWQSKRLFYTAIPRSFFLEMSRRLRESGQDSSDVDRLLELGMGWPDDQINAIEDVSQTVNAKWEALNCHRTQFGPENLFRKLPEASIKQLMSYEHYALAWPAPSPGLFLESLLSGLAD